MCVCVICHLPILPSPLTPVFFSDLLQKVIGYQNDGHILICGDFNARCGDECDYIEGVDSVPPHIVLDDKCNAVGYQ